MPEASQAIDTTNKPETFLHTVEVEISNEEAGARTKRLLEVLNEIDKIEGDKASRVSDFNTELKQKRKEAHKIRDAIHLGKERQDVECYEQPDERRNIVFIVRASDHKVLDERAMTLEDRMYLDKGKAPAAAADEPEAAAEGSGGGGDGEAEGKAGKAGKAGKGGGATVTRIKASDVKKRKAEREAKEAADKAKKLADEQDARNAAADDDDDDSGDDDDSDEDDDE